MDTKAPALPPDNGQEETRENCEACKVEQHTACPNTRGCPCCEHAAAMDAMEGLPPDPEGQNGDRAAWAESAIVAFEAATGTDREDALADLLCDLMHWADRNGADFASQLDRAYRNYEEETAAE